MADKEVTKFKGPGQWRSQAARLEREASIKEGIKQARQGKTKPAKEVLDEIERKES